MCFVGSLDRFGKYRGSMSVSTPTAAGWVTFFATAARPRNIHLDLALGGCQHERNINGRAGRGPVSIFLTNRRESLHQQQSPARWHSCSRGRRSTSSVCGHTRGDSRDLTSENVPHETSVRCRMMSPGTANRTEYFLILYGRHIRSPDVPG
jgi:hypothetical protein